MITTIEPAYSTDNSGIAAYLIYNKIPISYVLHKHGVCRFVFEEVPPELLATLHYHAAQVEPLEFLSVYKRVIQTARNAIEESSS